MQCKIEAATIVYLVILSAAMPARAADSLVSNGDFSKWTNGVPDGWTVEIGANNGGDTPRSEVKQIQGPALMLRGNTNTLAWHSVAQDISATPGGTFHLEFESRTKGVRREGNQHDNCYVGVMSFDAAGNRVGAKLEDVAGDADWTKHRVSFSVPEAAKKTTLLIFLSKSGILGVKNVAVTDAGASGAPLLANGNFKEWADGKPQGWTVDIGASNGGDTPASTIKRLDEPALELQGDERTLAWHSVSQELTLRQGRTYALAFNARSRGVQRQGRQFDNCYVGVMSFDLNGKRTDASLKDLSRPTNGWKPQSLTFTVPRNTSKTQLIIFLSKTGTLSVKNISLREAAERRPFRGAR